MLVGVGDGLGSVADAGLGEEMIDMALYRGLADYQPAGDLCVRQSLGDQCEHFGFSLCEPGGQLRCGCGGWARRDGADQVLLDRGVDGGLRWAD